MRTVQPIEPGYYRFEIKRITFRELARIAKGNIVIAAALTALRGQLSLPIQRGTWFPSPWVETEVFRESLSTRCLEGISEPVVYLESQGFNVVAYHSSSKHPALHLIDSGGAFLLHESGAYFARVEYIREKAKKTGGENENCLIWIVTLSQQEKSVGVTNVRDYPNLPSPDETVSLPGAPVSGLWNRTKRERARLDGKGYSVLAISGKDALERYIDEAQKSLLHNLVNERRVLVRMTDDEIATARRAWDFPNTGG